MHAFSVGKVVVCQTENFIFGKGGEQLAVLTH